MAEFPYQPSPVNVNSLTNQLYLVDFATATGDLTSNAVLIPIGHTNWILRKPTATDSTTIYIDTKFTQFIIDGQILTEANVGTKILIKNNTTMYATEPVAQVDKEYIAPLGAPTASTPYPPNVPGVYPQGGPYTEAYPDRAVGDAPPVPPVTIAGGYDPGAPWSATPANLTGQCSPYNYYPSHPYRDSTVIDISSKEYGIYQLVNYQVNTPSAGINRFTLTRTKESIYMLPGSIIFVRGGVLGQGQIFILDSNNENFCLGYIPNSSNLTLSGVYTISDQTTTVTGGLGANPIGDGLIAGDIVRMYGQLFKVLSVPTDLPVRFIVNQLPQYSKAGIQIVKMGNSTSFNTLTSTIEDPLIINDLTVNNDAIILGNTTLGVVSPPGPVQTVLIQSGTILDITGVTVIGGALPIINPITVDVQAPVYVASKLYGGNDYVSVIPYIPVNGPVLIDAISDNFVGPGPPNPPYNLTLQTTSSISNSSGDIILRTVPSTFGLLQSGSIYILPGANGGKCYINSIESQAGINLTFTSGAGAPNGIVMATPVLCNNNLTVNPIRTLFVDTISTSPGALSLVLSPVSGIVTVNNNIVCPGSVSTNQLIVNSITSIGAINFTGVNLTGINNATIGTVLTTTVQSAGALTLQSATNTTINAGGDIVLLTGTATINCSNNFLDTVGRIQQVQPLIVSSFIGEVDFNNNVAFALKAPNKPSQFLSVQTPLLTNRSIDASLTISTTPAPNKDIIINSSSGIINCSSGALTNVNGITFGTAPATQLTRYYEGTEALNYSGPFLVIAGNVKYTRIGRSVTLEMNAVQTPPNGPIPAIITSTAISVVSVRPSQTITGTLCVIDKGVEGIGTWQLTAGGVLTIYNGSYGATFPIGGAVNSGFRAFSITYTA